MAAVYNARNFLVELRLLRENVASFAQYPFTIPAIEGLDRLVFTRPVTFLVGENGAGKSTLLEAIATKWGLNPEGGSKNFNFSTRESHSALHHYLRLTRSAPPMRIFCAPKAISTSPQKSRNWTASRAAHRLSPATAANPCMNNRTANPSLRCS